MSSSSGGSTVAPVVLHLREELRRESISKQKQLELNAKLQDEYERVRKRLAEAENHIDSLRFGSTINVHKHFIISRQQEEGGGAGDTSTTGGAAVSEQLLMTRQPLPFTPHHVFPEEEGEGGGGGGGGGGGEGYPGSSCSWGSTGPQQGGEGRGREGVSACCAGGGCDTCEDGRGGGGGGRKRGSLDAGDLDFVDLGGVKSCQLADGGKMDYNPCSASAVPIGEKLSRSDSLLSLEDRLLVSLGFTSSSSSSLSGSSAAGSDNGVSVMSSVFNATDLQAVITSTESLSPSSSGAGMPPPPLPMPPFSEDKQPEDRQPATPTHVHVSHVVAGDKQSTPPHQGRQSLSSLDSSTKPLPPLDQWSRFTEDRQPRSSGALVRTSPPVTAAESLVAKPPRQLPETSSIEAGTSAMPEPRTLPSDPSLSDVPSRATSSRDTSPRATSLRGISPRDIPPKDTSPRATSLRGISPRDISPKDTSPRATSLRGISPRDIPPKDTSPRRMCTSPKETTKPETPSLRVLSLSPRTLSQRESGALSPRELGRAVATLLLPRTSSNAPSPNKQGASADKIPVVPSVWKEASPRSLVSPVSSQLDEPRASQRTPADRKEEEGLVTLQQVSVDQRQAPEQQQSRELESCRRKIVKSLRPISPNEDHEGIARQVKLTRIIMSNCCFFLLPPLFPFSLPLHVLPSS